METGSRGKEKSRSILKGHGFLLIDYLTLFAALALFTAVWFGVRASSKHRPAVGFYSKGYFARYDLEGAVADRLGSDTLEIRTVAEGKGTATVVLKAGENTDRIDVERRSAKVLQDSQTGVPLVFCYDIAEKPRDASATFGDEPWPYFSSEFTGLTERVRAHVKRRNSDNSVMWYHRSYDRSYGPRYCWELSLYDEANKKVGTIVNDANSGVLLNARFYRYGYGSMNLVRTNYPLSANRWALFIGLNAILVLWGGFHVVRAARHREEWEAHWSHFPLNFFGISRFFIRLLAFTVFDLAGIGILTGDLKMLFFSNLVGLALMVYAVGPFAFPVLFEFAPWMAAFGVHAGGRSLDYVQYPFAVPLYLICVVSYMLYRYLSYRLQQRAGLQGFLDSLPDVTREAVMRELESGQDETGGS